MRRILVCAAVAGLLVACSGTKQADPSQSSEAASSTTRQFQTTRTAPPSEPEMPALDDGAETVTAEQLNGITFTNVTKAAGLNVVHSQRSLFGIDSMSAGAAVADVDGDGWDDLYVTRIGAKNSLYHNTGKGTFVEVTDQANLGGQNPEQGSSAAAFADIDGDGDQDLYVASAGRAPNALYINDGTGHFADETTKRGLELPPVDRMQFFAQMHGVTFGDVNNDGHLDLLTLHWDTSSLGDDSTAANSAQVGSDQDRLNKKGYPCKRIVDVQAAGFQRAANADPNRSRLFLNDGSGNFTDATQSMGLDLVNTVAFTGVFADVDGDGFQDLFVTGDACTSKLFKNIKGTKFEDVSQSAGIGKDENGMGSVVRDINGDGKLDWFVTSISYPTADQSCPAKGGFTGCTGNHLYLGNGDFTFRDATQEYGVSHGWWGWGAAIEDFGNDGRLGVMMTNGLQGEPTQTPQDGVDPNKHYFGRFVTDPNRFWIPVPGSSSQLVNAATSAGVADTHQGKALIPFDYDHDGDLDVFIATTNAEPILYRNDTPPHDPWMAIRLDDPTTPGNRRGEGAVITTTTASGRAVVQPMTSGGSYESQKPLELHVSAAPSDPIDHIDVRWPGSSTSQRVSPVTMGTSLTIIRSG